MLSVVLTRSDMIDKKCVEVGEETGMEMEMLVRVRYADRGVFIFDRIEARPI